MFEFNPTIFKFKEKVYSLIRIETNTKNWGESNFSYNINLLDSDLKIINTNKCIFKINNNCFSEIKRINIKKNYYTLEDIKIIDNINNSIIGICNVLIQNKPRIFRCGIVYIDVNKSTINLIKILSIPEMFNDEKNWTILNNTYLIYSLFPELIIYTINKNYDLFFFKKINTIEKIKNTHIMNNLNPYYKNLYLTPCQNCIKLNEQYYLIYSKKKSDNNYYEYYYCVLDIINYNLNFINNKLFQGFKRYLNSVIYMNNNIHLSWGLSDTKYKIEKHKIKINLDYWDGWHNFGDELSKFITEQLINKDKYELVFNKNNIPLNIVCIGSYIHRAKNNSFVFGTGVRTPDNIENGHKYINLNVCSVRGPYTRELLINSKNINVPEIYGDPALLMPKFYKPCIIDKLKNKIGVVPHKTNYIKYKFNIDTTKYYLINPIDNWQNVINYICSCKAIISSSLHGLICSDAYNIPNLWLDEYKLEEGDFKFKDYFASQNRDYVKIKNLNEYNSSLLYKGGNNIDLDKLLKTFPFS